VPEIAPLLADLQAESQELDDLVAAVSPADWAMPTPAPGWTIAHQIGHLHWTDEVSVLAATEPAAFTDRMRAFAQNPAVVDDEATRFAELPVPELLARWRSGRAELGKALAECAPEAKLPWFGPPMRATSMATARIMETWAHGQDVADALGVRRAPTARLRHVAHIAVRARDFAYLVNNVAAPTEEIHVALVAEDGSRWTWGSPSSAQKVTGRALDFCLLATRRRHRDDTDLVATGADADRWLDIVQAFAGPPGHGRNKGQFA
jgi:uncharacterized protein (TIGR03084 family)